MSEPRRLIDRSTASASISLAFVLAAKPSRADAFRAAFAAVLHAGFGFGSDRPGQVVFSYDPQGEHYAAPEVVPAGRHGTLAQALDGLSALANHYNQSIGLSFSTHSTVVPVTGRVYDEAGALAVHLDFGKDGWRGLVATCRTVRLATATMVDAGRTVFTLVPARYLLIGPSSLLVDLPRAPDAMRLRMAPVAMVARHYQAALEAIDKEYFESTSRGSIIVRRWDASATMRAALPSKVSPTRRTGKRT